MSYHSSIKKAPFKVLFGYKTPTLQAMMDYPKAQTIVGEYLKSRQKMLTLLKKELTTARNRMKQTTGEVIGASMWETKCS